MDFKSNFDVDVNKLPDETQLVKNVKEALIKSGAADVLKSQFRREVISTLAPKQAQQESLDIQEKVLYSLIYHVFKKRKMVNSLSVFVPESGINPKQSLLSEKDIKQLVKYNKIASDYDKFSGQKENKGPHSVDEKHCIMDYILQFCLNMNQNIQKEIATQTDVVGPSIREFLDIQITNLQSKYAERSAAEAKIPSKTIEERMFIYQRECEARFQNDLRAQVAAIRENEMLKVRLEENAKCRLMLEQQRAELDAEYGIRIQGHMDREATSARRLAERERELERSHYDSRQLYQREIDDLRNREALMIAKTQGEMHSVKMLELRLKESEQVLNHRESDLARREKALSDQTRDCYEAARKEAKAQVQAELDANTKDREVLMIERKRFDEEKSTHAAFMSNYAVIKDRLDKTLQELIAVQDELGCEKRAAQRLQLLREEEDRQINEIMKSVVVNHNPANANEHFTHIQHIVTLIQINAKLTSDLAAVRDPRGLETALKACQMDLTKAQTSLHNAQRDSEILTNKLKVEINALQLEVAELSKNLHAKEATVDHLRTQLNERNKTIEELSRLNNWQGGVNVHSQMPKVSVTDKSAVLVNHESSLMPPALSDEYYTQWLLGTTEFAAHDARRPPAKETPSGYLSTAESLFSQPKQPALVSHNPFNYPPGAWVPPVTQPQPAYQQQQLQPQQAHFASQQQQLQQQQLQQQQLQQQPQHVKSSLYQARDSYPYSAVAAAEPDASSRGVAAASPLPTTAAAAPVKTLNPPLISTSSYNPVEDPQSIVYRDVQRVQYKPAAAASAPVSAAPTAATVVTTAAVVAAEPNPPNPKPAITPSAGAASLVRLFSEGPSSVFQRDSPSVVDLRASPTKISPTAATTAAVAAVSAGVVDEEEKRLESEYQAMLQKQREAKVAEAKERQRQQAAAAAAAEEEQRKQAAQWQLSKRLREEQEAAEAAEAAAEQQRRDDEKRRLAVLEQEKAAARERERLAAAAALERAAEEQARQRRREAEEQEEADQAATAAAAAAAAAAARKAQLEADRLAAQRKLEQEEEDAREAAAAAAAAEKQRQEQVRIEKERAATAAKAAAEEQRERNEFLERERQKRLAEQREEEEARAAERAAAEAARAAERAEEDRRLAAVRAAEEERLRKEREAREEQERREREAREAAEEQRRLDEIEKVETIRKAREEVIRRREAARTSTESLNSRSSVTSLPAGGVSVSQSMERTGGMRGSTTSAFSYGTHDSGSESDAPNLQEDSDDLRNDNTIEVNEMSSDDSQDRSW